MHTLWNFTPTGTTSGLHLQEDCFSLTTWMLVLKQTSSCSWTNPHNPVPSWDSNYWNRTAYNIRATENTQPLKICIDVLVRNSHWQDKKYLIQDFKPFSINSYCSLYCLHLWRSLSFSSTDTLFSVSFTTQYRKACCIFTLLGWSDTAPKSNTGHGWSWDSVCYQTQEFLVTTLYLTGASGTSFKYF